MKIDKVSMQGPCKGVIRALKIINDTLNDSTVKKPIYMLGKIVHNDNIINAYKNKGIIVLDGKSRIEMAKEISDGTVIITAHGVGDDVYDYFDKHHITYIDATCPDVLKTNHLIKEKLKENYKIIYIGTKQHPEAEGMLSLSSDIHFLSSKANDVEIKNIISLLSYEKVFCTCQTTLSYFDVLKIYEKLKQQKEDLEFSSEVCNATRLRQTALINEVKNYDLCLVVGDKHSNNTNSLKNVCKQVSDTKCHLIESCNDLNNIDFTNVNNVIITSGASTPRCIVNEIVSKLSSFDIPFKSDLTLDDYITIK